VDVAIFSIWLSLSDVFACWLRQKKKVSVFQKTKILAYVGQIFPPKCPADIVSLDSLADSYAFFPVSRYFWLLNQYNAIQRVY
jgi:hypothetical protein